MATKEKAAPKPKAAAKPKPEATTAKCSCHADLEALAERVATLESAMRLELGVDPAAHKAAQERTVGGPAGDAGAV